ncbi:hypothetical protein BJ508DRAFT_306620 [Ascobolus immersus RN42]|uniref:Uncharacterized protein n=1 Tax=Ascobolus immersus RN42 TaxID=1160509 RepID=A0A3N4IB38_ASCIM|nr:hypothetical protein BJ508DRAFT_306620 [Ascobolus immersus RN42]
MQQALETPHGFSPETYSNMSEITSTTTISDLSQRLKVLQLEKSSTRTLSDDALIYIYSAFWCHDLCIDPESEYTELLQVLGIPRDETLGSAYRQTCCTIEAEITRRFQEQNPQYTISTRYSLVKGFSERYLDESRSLVELYWEKYAFVVKMHPRKVEQLGFTISVTGNGSTWSGGQVGVVVPELMRAWSRNQFMYQVIPLTPKSG